MDVRFPFEFIGKDRFGNIYRPVAKVNLKSPQAEIFADIWMIIDTGADFTILPRHIADKLRISVEKDCHKDITYGIGGEQVIYFCKNKINAKIGKLERQIPLAFLDSNEVPPLLGRLGFLETFNVELLKTHITVFKN